MLNISHIVQLVDTSRAWEPGRGNFKCITLWSVIEGEMPFFFKPLKHSIYGILKYKNDYKKVANFQTFRLTRNFHSNRKWRKFHTVMLSLTQPAFKGFECDISRNFEKKHSTHHLPKAELSFQLMDALLVTFLLLVFCFCIVVILWNMLHLQCYFYISRSI